MDRHLHPKTVLLARESLGLTQSQLAHRLGITQGKVSKIEMGLQGVAEEIVPKLSQVLGFPAEFFYEQVPAAPPKFCFFRKASSAGAREINRVRSMCDIDTFRIGRLFKSVSIDANIIPHFPAGDDLRLDPEGAAQAVREAWNIESGPIENLTSYLEAAGIVIFLADLGARPLSELTLRTEDGTFVVFVNQTMPWDRIRFTLAHSLGHMVLHEFGEGTESEREADAFAAAFLLPRADIQHQLSSLTLARLADLKRYWKVSMQSLLYRAKQLNTITPAAETNLWMQISKNGYRTKEPESLNVPRERITLVRSLVELHLKELGYTTGELVRMLFLRADELSKYGLLQQTPVLRLHEWATKNDTGASQ